MNLSLKNRIALSFIIANLTVLLLTFMVFYFLNSHNKQVEDITQTSHKASLLSEEMRMSAIGIIRYHRKIISERGKAFAEMLENVTDLCESFIAQLQTLDAFYQDVEIKKHTAQMLTYLDSLKLVLTKLAPADRDPTGMSTFGELADRILESFSEFQNMQYKIGTERDEQIQILISETKRRMLITLIIGFLATILLTLVVPSKVALPFKKIRDAIRELKDCNFDVSIYYDQNDEIGEIASEMNQMIAHLKEFEILRTERISVELRKFDALANAIRRPVLVSNAENKLIYMNNTMYSLLGIGSEDVIGQEMKGTILPSSIVSAFEQAIKKRVKLEEVKIQIFSKKIDSEHADDLVDKAQETAQADVLDLPSESLEKEIKEDLLFDGHATVIPIRGKTSSLDYYLMVLSLDSSCA